ncbi:MAG: DUF1963 domain-containing protein [Planctomycetes bacterium]|nr:DUF1963 domain-containing protein [Planctomycetota bacterium]
MSPLAQHEDRQWLSSIVANLADDTTKLIYADWLDDHGDDRGRFLREFVICAKTMEDSDLPDPDGLPEPWLELIGFRLIERMVIENIPNFKDPVLRLARPALRMITKETDDSKIEICASKIGGLPDFPPGFIWPPGGDCHAIFNDDTGGTDRLAGFLAQVNLSEIAHTQAAKDLPETGLLSFFCFQDVQNDHPDAIGAMAIYFPDASGFIRTNPPKKLTDGNTIIPSCQLTFEETLDLPQAGIDIGPWGAELAGEGLFDNYLDHVRYLNFDNILGYARATTGNDPTPSKQSRHLIVLKNAVGCRLHIQILQDDLTARRFDKITLNWVDFW